MVAIDIPKDTEIIVMPSKIFGWIESFNDETFDIVMNAISNFDNDVPEMEESAVVFDVKGKYPKFFRFLVGGGTLKLDEWESERDTIMIMDFESISSDEYLDELLDGHQIKLGKDKKRIIMNFSLV